MVVVLISSYLYIFSSSADSYFGKHSQYPSLCIQYDCIFYIGVSSIGNLEHSAFDRTANMVCEVDLMVLTLDTAGDTVRDGDVSSFCAERLPLWMSLAVAQWWRYPLSNWRVFGNRQPNSAVLWVHLQFRHQCVIVVWRMSAYPSATD